MGCKQNTASSTLPSPGQWAQGATICRHTAFVNLNPIQGRLECAMAQASPKIFCVTARPQIILTPKGNLEDKPGAMFPAKDSPPADMICQTTFRYLAEDHEHLKIS